MLFLASAQGGAAAGAEGGPPSSWGPSMEDSGRPTVALACKTRCLGLRPEPAKPEPVWGTRAQALSHPPRVAQG